MPLTGDPRPIGVFDSGVGGLTVLAELRRRLPAEPTLYLGDNARAPYGPRPPGEVRTFARESARWLAAQDVKLLVIACNTATAHALEGIRAAVDVPVIGVIRPGAVMASAATRAGHVGVIATAGTVGSGAYERAILEANSAIEVSQQACPDLVPLVEGGHAGTPEAKQAVERYLGQLFEADPAIDTLLLGCTHYPILRPSIEAVAGPRVSVVDSAFTTALATEDLLDALGRRSGGTAPGSNRITTTGDVDAFTMVARSVFGAELPAVHAVSVAPASGVAAVDS
ncbi:MAG: glutamate racemase [Chloroflexota bacterium]